VWGFGGGGPPPPPPPPNPQSPIPNPQSPYKLMNIKIQRKNIKDKIYFEKLII